MVYGFWGFALNWRLKSERIRDEREMRKKWLLCVLTGCPNQYGDPVQLIKDGYHFSITFQFKLTIVFVVDN